MSTVVGGAIKFYNKSILKTSPCLTVFQKRWKKLAPNPPFRRLSDPHEVAIEHMDKINEQYFTDEWPSIRCAMLSRNKFAALINNHSKKVADDEMISNGAIDILENIRAKARDNCVILANEIKSLEIMPEEEINYENIDLLHNEYKQYKSFTEICPGMKVYCHPREVIKEIKPSKQDEYYLIDAASLLPIIALNPQRLDKILDYVAAPALFLSLLLQTSYNSILCTHWDRVESTLIIEKLKSNWVKFKKRNLIEDTEIETDFFDKVIINAPCTDDRESMQPREDNHVNMYSRLRKNERAQLPYTQTKILCDAIISCKPGGTIVYSTNTAQALQNEIVVHTAIQSLAEQDIECEVVDLQILGDLVKDHMNVFYNSSNIGILVTPHVEANFGPIYTCKINRIK